MSVGAEQVCPRTGFRLVAAEGQTTYRIAQDRYVSSSGILGVLVNRAVGHLPEGAEDLRGRYDTVGRTVYFATSIDCALAEVLTVFRHNQRALEADAAAIEPEPGEGPVDVAAYVEAVTKEAVANDRDTPWAITGAWQTARSLLHVRMPLQGWWVRIDHSDTIDAFNASVPPAQLAALRGTGDMSALTLSDVTGPTRALTTHLAEIVRQSVLDDGSLPLGINYPSKTGAGRCLAYWARSLDEGEPGGSDNPAITHSDAVGVPEFYERASRWNLQVLQGRYLG